MKRVIFFHIRVTLNIELKIKNMDSFIGSLTYTEAATGGVLSEKCY